MSYVQSIIHRAESVSRNQVVSMAAYSRVSTPNEAQKDSCSNQVATAKDFAASHINTSLQDDNIYVDDGISGKSVVGRQGYQRLINAIESKRIELVLVKTSSRLFRSVEESQAFIRTLLKHEVVLYTMEDHKYWDFTFQGDVIMFTFMSVINAATSKTQSDAGHMAQERRIKDKKLMPKDLVTGYKWNPDTKEIIPDPETAPYIVDIFESYTYRNENPRTICNELKSKGIKFPKHKRDHNTKKTYIVYEYLCERTISKILANVKYIGLFTLNTRSSTFIPGEETKRYKTAKEDQHIIDRPDLQIVDKDLFYMTQRLRHSKGTIYIKRDKEVTRGYFEGTSKFSRLIYCFNCGKPYYHDYADRGKKIPIYRVRSHTDCANPIHRIYEADLINITKKALKQTLEQQEEVYREVEKVLTEVVSSTQNNQHKINILKNQRASYEKNLSNMIDRLADDELNDQGRKRVNDRINQLADESERLLSVINDLESKKLDNTYISDNMARIKSALTDLRNFSSMDRTRIRNYIDKIYMHPEGNIEIVLKSSQIIMEKSTEKQYNNGDSFIGDVVSETGIQDVRCSSPVPYPVLRSP